MAANIGSSKRLLRNPCDRHHTHRFGRRARGSARKPGTATGFGAPAPTRVASSWRCRQSGDALNRNARQWHLACSSGGLSGIRAATLAGLGVTAQSRLLLGNDLVQLPASQGLPELDEVEFVVLGRSARLAGSSAALASVIKMQASPLSPAGAAPDV